MIYFEESEQYSEEYKTGYLDALSDVLGLLADTPLADAVGEIETVIVNGSDD